MRPRASGGHRAQTQRYPLEQDQPGDIGSTPPRRLLPLGYGQEDITRARHQRDRWFKGLGQQCLQPRS